MTAAYAIAKRLPIEDRRYAVSLAYTERGAFEGRRAVGSDGTICCPLGACLRRGPAAGVPTANDVGVELGGGLVTASTIRGEARSFIDNWDEGVIANLADALGVKP